MKKPSLFRAPRRTAVLVLMLGIFLALAPLSAAQAAAQAGNAQPPAGRPRVGIAATVNDDVITMSDVINRVKLYASGSGRQYSDAELARMEQETLERLIDEKLQLQEAKALSITVADEQVAQGFAEIARQNGLDSAGFRDRLTRAGVTPATLEDQLRAEAAWRQVVLRKLRPQINISESEIDNEMDMMKRSGGKKEYHVAEIFLPVTVESQDAEIRRAAEAIVAELLSGARFSDIAKEKSQSPGAAMGGDIGWVQDGQLEAPLNEALGKMQTGQVSPPLRGQKGYYILFLRNQRNNGAVVTNAAAAAPAAPAPAAAAPATPPVAEVVLLLKQLTIPAAKDEPAVILNAKTVRAQSLAAEITSCDAMDAKAAEFSTTAASGRHKISALPEPLQKLVGDLEPNKLSAPLRTPEGVSVFMVCAREEVMVPAAATAQPAPAPAPAPAPVAAAAPAPDSEQAREEVANKLGTQRLGLMQERYLRDLRATAFIERRI